jgi:hypothetical protein
MLRGARFQQQNGECFIKRRKTDMNSGASQWLVHFFMKAKKFY